MQHYAVVFFPKGDLEKIQSFRNTYDPMAHVLPPHVTLVFPFKNIPEEEINKHLAQVVQNTKSFSLTFNGLFRSFDNYLFLLVDKGKGAVFALHDKLYSGIFAPLLNDDIPFIPHLTIGSFMKDVVLDEAGYKKAKKEAEEKQFTFSYKLDAITLIQGDGIRPAKIIQTFFLSK